MPSSLGTHIDLTMLIAIAGAVASLVLMVGGALLWRRERFLVSVFAGGLFAAVVARACFRWDELLPFLAFFLESSLVGAVTYGLLRHRKAGFSPRVARCVGAAGAAVTPLLLAALGRSFFTEQGLWMVAVVPSSLLVAPLVLLVACTARAAYRGAPEEAVRRSEANGQERQAVLKMVADGKVSPEEASELLGALGQPDAAGATSAASVITLAHLAGAVMIATGFVLPWVFVQIGPVHGYQAGHNVGALGWIVLSLGLLPAVLACIPALDGHLGHGTLRLLLAATGLAFAVSLAVPIVAGGRFPGIGLILVLLGFAVQVPSALLDTGLLHRPPRQASP